MLNIQEIQNSKRDKIGFFRFKKFDNEKYLITNDIGKFVFLSNEDFGSFVKGDVENLAQYEELLKKGFIKEEDYQLKMSNSLAKKYHFVGLGPTLHMVVPTLRCNHACRYCHAAVAPMHAEGLDMDIETATRVVDTILYTNSPDLTIEFQGGEALVNYPIIQYIVDYASKQAKYLHKNIKFTLVSNLTLMDEEKLTWLLDNGVDICTSLDGDEITHNHNRSGYKGNSFEKVTYWMKRVDEEKQKRGMGKIGALLTVTNETIPKYKEIIDTYRKLGLPGIFLRWLNPYGFAANNLKKLAYKTEDWVDFYRKAMDYILEINKSGELFYESITTVYLMKIFNDIDPAFMDIRSPSGPASGCLAYMYDGKIYASDESRMLGRMGDDSFLVSEGTGSGAENYAEIMNSDIRKTMIQSSTLDGLPGFNEHVYKPYIGVDIIHNYKVEGSLYQPLVIDEKMKIQFGILDYIFEKLQNSEDAKILMSWIGK